MINPSDDFKEMYSEVGEWQPYVDYEKQFCNIRLKNGMEYGPCWPNAGQFNVWGESQDRKLIHESEVTHIQYYK